MVRWQSSFFWLGCGAYGLKVCGVFLVVAMMAEEESSVRGGGIRGLVDSSSSLADISVSNYIDYAA